MRATTVILAALTFCAAWPGHADYSVKDEGTWPKTWPAELDPLRKQSRTLRGSLLDLTNYEIPFASREEFEAAWPHLLRIKDNGAPIVLRRSPDESLGLTLKAGVRIRCALGHPDHEVKPTAPTPSTTSVRECWLRSTYIELVVDGQIVDLNRIPLPAETPIIDERFKGGPDRSPDRSGG